MKLLRFSLFIIFAGCTPVTQTSNNQGGTGKNLRLMDLTYEPLIRTVLLHPPSNDPKVTLLPSVAKLGYPLVLEFDELTAQRDTYYARIIHCNYDWTKSILMDLDFLNEYNEFPINNFEFSVDSHIPYNHYWFTLPPVKLPGNYVVVVYRAGDKNDIILSRRFMIYENRVSIGSEQNLIGAGSLARANQQINFNVNYKDIELINPLESIQVVIRQNERWDNMVTGVKPTFIREFDKELEYRFADENKLFKGGSEFRWFDIRSLNHPGRNVAKVDRSVRPFEVYIETDKPRGSESYSQLPDFNGDFVLENFDFRNTGYSNYAYINFELASPEINGDVYVAGAFNYWNLNSENRMLYDSIAKEYYARVLLKQGWYDYQYVVRSKTLPPHYFEGSHFETENDYEIFVYYRPFQPKADILVGYRSFTLNAR